MAKLYGQWKKKLYPSDVKTASTRPEDIRRFFPVLASHRRSENASSSSPWRISARDVGLEPLHLRRSDTRTSTAWNRRLAGRIRRLRNGLLRCGSTEIWVPDSLKSLFRWRFGGPIRASASNRTVRTELATSTTVRLWSRLRDCSSQKGHSEGGVGSAGGVAAGSHGGTSSSKVLQPGGIRSNVQLA